VRERINKPTGTLTPADVASLNEIYANGLGISDLAGLECWPNLEYLDVRDNQLDASDLEVVKSLNRLKTLKISCNPIQDLTGIASHPTLEVLEFSQVGCSASLSNIDAVGTLKSLESVDLSGHGLSDVGSLAQLRGLRTVQLSGNALTSVADLATLPLLETLYLVGNDVSDISPLSSKKSLRALDVSRNELTSLAAVSTLTSLELLAADHNQITSVDSLSGLTNLRELYVSNNAITTLEPLASLGNLGWLDVWGNQLTRLEPLLAGNGPRGTLLIGDNPLPCNTEQDHIDTLKKLGVQIYGSCTPE
jgi:Leucine-rich repeat (LRR) protein